jgi:hypothetical protein
MYTSIVNALKISITFRHQYATVAGRALIDSGTTENFIDYRTAVMVLWPHCSGQPDRPSTSSSNTSSSSASQSALQAVALDTPDRRTAWVLAAHRAARQERYDKSAFLAQLAEALRRHSMAVRVGHTSTHMMQGIINELARLQHA